MSAPACHLGVTDATCGENESERMVTATPTRAAQTQDTSQGRVEGLRHANILAVGAFIPTSGLFYLCLTGSPQWRGDSLCCRSGQLLRRVGEVMRLHGLSDHGLVRLHDGRRCPPESLSFFEILDTMEVSCKGNLQ